MVNRIAAIGDIHACYEELETLYNHLCWFSLDEIWHVGDVVDRGPHSGKAVEFCRTHNIKGVMGNHDESIINHWNAFHATGRLSRNLDKQRTVSELCQDDVTYLQSLPYLHIFDDLGLILAHAGLWPKIPLYAQPTNVCRVNMIHPDKVRQTRWFGSDAVFGPGKKTEEQSLKEGWTRWYKSYDYQEDLIFGHSTFAQPVIFQNPGYGRCIGIDTGSCFGGMVTACIYNSDKTFSFLGVKAKELYYKDAHRAFIEGQ